MFIDSEGHWWWEGKNDSITSIHVNGNLLAELISYGNHVLHGREEFVQWILQVCFSICTLNVGLLELSTDVYSKELNHNIRLEELKELNVSFDKARYLEVTFLPFRIMVTLLIFSHRCLGIAASWKYWRWVLVRPVFRISLNWSRLEIWVKSISVGEKVRLLKKFYLSSRDGDTCAD